MKRYGLVIVLLIAALACSLTRAGSPVPAATTQPAPVVPASTFTPTGYPPDLIAYYPLTADLNDATGQYGALMVKNAPLQPGGGLFCNGIYITHDPSGCDILTPLLNELDFQSFTISVQFFVPEKWIFPNPVLAGGDDYRWLVYVLEPDGSIQLVYNNSQEVECSVTYQLNTWHEAILTYDGQTATLYLDKTPGCSATAALVTEGDKQVGQTNFSDATAFYGTVRELRVYNGVVPPAEIPFP
jgi:hypothetical protein